MGEAFVHNIFQIIRAGKSGAGTVKKSGLSAVMRISFANRALFIT